MKQVENITYEEWVALVRRAGLDGLTGEVFEALQVYYPLSSGSAYEKMIYNEGKNKRRKEKTECHTKRYFYSSLMRIAQGNIWKC